MVPVPVVLQRVQDVLGVRMDQIGPRLPQRVDDKVYEANLEQMSRAAVSKRTEIFSWWKSFYLGHLYLSSLH